MFCRLSQAALILYIISFQFPLASGSKMKSYDVSSREKIYPLLWGS